MKNHFASAIAYVLMTAAVLLTGCTTPVKDVRKDEQYTKRLTATTVAWGNMESLLIRTTHPLNQPFPETSIARSKQRIAELHALFKREAPGAVSASLKASAVIVQPAEGAAATRLRITPVSAQNDCAAAGCSQALWLDVELFDFQEDKTVWSARFLISAPFDANDPASLRRFTDTLISRLKSSNLL